MSTCQCVSPIARRNEYFLQQTVLSAVICIRRRLSLEPQCRDRVEA